MKPLRFVAKEAARLLLGQVNEELEHERRAAEEAEQRRRLAIEQQKLELHKLEEARQQMEEAAQRKQQEQEEREAQRRFAELQVSKTASSWDLDRHNL